MKLQQGAAIKVIHAHSLLPHNSPPVLRIHLDQIKSQTTPNDSGLPHYLWSVGSSEIHAPPFLPHDDLNWPQNRKRSTRYKWKSRKQSWDTKPATLNSADLCHGTFLQVSSIEGLKKKTKGGKHILPLVKIPELFFLGGLTLVKILESGNEGVEISLRLLRLVLVDRMERTKDEKSTFCLNPSFMYRSQ